MKPFRSTSRRAKYRSAQSRRGAGCGALLWAWTVSGARTAMMSGNVRSRGDIREPPRMLCGSEFHPQCAHIVPDLFRTVKRDFESIRKRRGALKVPALPEIVAAHRERRSGRVERARRRLGEPGEAARDVDELFRHHVDDEALALQATAAEHQGGPHHLRAEPLEGVGPDHEVRDPGLVLEGDEHHAAGAAGPLAHQDETCDGDEAPGLDRGELDRARHAL